MPTTPAPLTPAVLHILLALADGDRHGYAITSEIARATGGKFRMGPGTLYGTIQRLLAGGLVEESADRPEPELDDQRRRYYRLTATGRDALGVEIGRLQTLVELSRTKRVIAKEVS